VLEFCSGHIPLLTARSHRLAYRLSAGRVGGTLPGYRIAWLTTTGRRTGRPRTWPLLYLTDGSDYVVLASNNGNDNHPHWYLNLMANPAAVLEVNRRKIPVTARTASPADRQRLWPIAMNTYPLYQAVGQRTSREIPVVVLTPR
jgi:deazaflavin-dependent oxidoreductase (nitroreductase family)